MDYQEIMAMLKERKQELKYSSTDITKITGFNSSQVNLWLNGKGSITLSRLIKLLDSLKLKITITNL